MCLWNKDAPCGNKVKIWQSQHKSNIFTPPQPKGCVMSVKCACEQLLDELPVKVWLLYHHPYFKY